MGKGEGFKGSSGFPQLDCLSDRNNGRILGQGSGLIEEAKVEAEVPIERDGTFWSCEDEGDVAKDLLCPV